VTRAVISSIAAVINEVTAQAGKALTTDQANQLVAAANGVKTALGCMKGETMRTTRGSSIRVANFRRRFGRLLLVSCGALAFAAQTAVGSTDGKAATHAGTAVVLKLNEKRGSGVSGTATLRRVVKGVRVVVRLSEPVPGSLPAHIHTGPCSREPTFANPRIWRSLNYVVGGRSATTVGTTLKTLRARRFSINVHDPESLLPIACGDIPRAS
jgi:hypothetical protein